MYLHIGKNDILLLKDIIGIFDIEIIKNSEENKKFLQQFNFSEDAKSIIITNKNKQTKGHVSNISMLTLQKRVVKGEYEETETI